MTDDLKFFSPFEFPTLHGQTQSAVRSIAFTRNEELNIFASGGSDRRVKVFKTKMRYIYRISGIIILDQDFNQK
jgi:hypothetical protein